MDVKCEYCGADVFITDPQLYFDQYCEDGKYKSKVHECEPQVDWYVIRIKELEQLNKRYLRALRNLGSNIV